MVLAAAGVLLGGCGGGDDEAAVRTTVQRYFAAVAARDGGAACNQLTESSRERVGEFAEPLGQDARAGCPGTMRAVFGSSAFPRLQTLRDPRFERVRVDDGHATVRVRDVGSPLRLERRDGGWRIEFTPAVEADRLPGGPHEREADGDG
jgi:hypothetical protein